MDKRVQAAIILAGALLVGAIARDIAGREAALLGLSVVELAIFGAGACAVVRSRLA